MQKKWLLYPENLGEYLSIDETSLSHGELYTIVTNKAAKGRKGAIVAILLGTMAETVIQVLQKTPERQRLKVKEISLDRAGNMEMIAKRYFRCAVRVTDRFHVYKLSTEALQEMRIKYRWEALDAKNEAIDKAREIKTSFNAKILPNGETLKQLLARARYVFYKKPAAWSKNQKERADLLLEWYPALLQTYNLSMGLSNIFEKTIDKPYGLARLAKWHKKVRQSGFKSFNTISRSIQYHYQTILNYFDNRSTNASAESFNAKIKALEVNSGE